MLCVLEKDTLRVGDEPALPAEPTDDARRAMFGSALPESPPPAAAADAAAAEVVLSALCFFLMTDFNARSSDDESVPIMECRLVNLRALPPTFAPLPGVAPAWKRPSFVFSFSFVFASVLSDGDIKL